MTLFSRLTSHANSMALRRYAARIDRDMVALDPDADIFGSEAVGDRLQKGELRFGGEVRHLPDTPPPFGLGSDQWEAEAQRFLWLDDLAALGSEPARELARKWTDTWLFQQGGGSGPGWTLPLTSERMTRLVSHYSFLADPEDDFFTGRLQQSLRLSTTYLAKRWNKSDAWPVRLNALSAALIGAMEIPAVVADLKSLIDTHAKECKRQTDIATLVPTRNPEDLLQVFSMLVMVKTRLTRRDELIPPRLTYLLQKLAPMVRVMRHGDGRLARFHGADLTPEGQVDRALAFSGVRTPGGSGGVALGYGRLSAGRTTLVIDAGKPPELAFSARAHASALAFEMTSGRRPVIVSAGPGDNFGPAWLLAGRATPSHSTLSFSGLSQARIAQRGRQRPGDPVLLDHGPTIVSATSERTEDGTEMICDHNAYVSSHGLWHRRLLRLSLDGRQIEAIDRLECRSPQDEAVFAAAREARTSAFAFALRFHLHPDVVADVALNGAAVSLTLKSGEVWLFRHDGTCDVSLEPSVWLTRDETAPVPAEQIVLSAVADEKRREMRWTLSKTQDTPRGIRDLYRDDPHS